MVEALEVCETFCLEYNATNVHGVVPLLSSFKTLEYETRGNFRNAKDDVGTV